MEFGLFLLSPQLDATRCDKTVLNDTIELGRAAEELGFDALWVAEHHFANLSLSPSPLLALAHIAARTSSIRLGTGVLVLPLYQPLRLAEEIAYVDVISNGRLNVGVGSGSQAHEARGFETDLSDAHERFLEVLDIVQMAFDDGVVAFQGKHFRIAPTPMSIRPQQQPHPPIYVAGMSGDAAVTTRIAERGYTAFSSLFGPAEEAPSSKREQYLQGYDAAGVPRAECRFAAQRIVYLTDDEAQARDAAQQALLTMRAVSTLKGPSAQFSGHRVQCEPLKHEPDVDELLEGLMIGSPEKVARLIAADLEVLNPVHFSCFMQFGNIDRARTLRSMQRFMAEVAPQFKD